VRVAVLGCGHVGRALVELLTEPARAEEITLRSGVAFEVVGIAVRDLARQRSEAPWFPHRVLTDDAKGLVERDDVDVVVELIGGLDPARDLVEAALRAGRPVVTANKVLLAAAGRELGELAEANGVDLLYEASVAGAIPVIRPLRESLAGERIVRVMGIVNGTTNFILSRMSEDGIDYADALAEAQRLGLAEADPAADVEGLDAAAKAAILAGLAFGCDVVAADVHHEGITGVRAIDVTFAARMGYAIKLLAVAELLDGPAGEEVSVRVHPTMIGTSHPLATVGGAFNAVFVEGEISGELMLYGHGAGGRPTAGAVLGDLIDAARHRHDGTAAPPPSRRVPVRFAPVEDLRSAFYLNVDVVDRAGVLAAVAGVFGNHGVSIRSMEQVGLGDEAEARLVFLTHEARQGDVAATIDDLRHLPEVHRVGAVLRVMGPDFQPGYPEAEA